MGERKGLPWGRNDARYDPLGLPWLCPYHSPHKGKDLTPPERYYKEVTLKTDKALAPERYEEGDHTVWSRLHPRERARHWSEYHASQAVRHQRAGGEDLAEHHRAQAEKYRSMIKGE